nr:MULTISPECIES: hypothetical protein [unclassified Bradyrhizobium]
MIWRLSSPAARRFRAPSPVKVPDKWRAAFEDRVRWVAPIQASSRLVMEDTEIRGCLIAKGDTVMRIQASANRGR